MRARWSHHSVWKQGRKSQIFICVQLKWVLVLSLHFQLALAAVPKHSELLIAGKVKKLIKNSGVYLHGLPWNCIPS